MGDPMAFMILKEQEQRRAHALIVGLAYGSYEEALLPYLMPKDLVVQDIETTTRWKVVEPKKSA
jgi:hypothetical protein